MQFLAALALMASVGAVEIGLAPDQPLPFVYVDDPLIVELRPDGNYNATVRTVVTEAATGRQVESTEENVVLQNGGAHWMVLESLPKEQGYYTFHIEVETADFTTRVDTGFCRIPRPAAQPSGESNNAAPFSAHQNTPDRHVLLALQSMGITRLELGPEARDAALCQDALRLGFRVSGAGNGPAAEGEPGCPEAMTTWVLRGAPDRVLATGERLRDAGVSAPLYAFVPSLEAGTAMLELDTARRIAGLQLPLEGILDALPALRDAAESHGHEAWSIAAFQAAPSHLDDEGAIQLLRDGLDALAAGASGLVFDDAWIYNDTAVGPWLLYCGALSKRMTARRFAGRLDLGAGVHAPLFRDGARWFLPVWTDGPERQVTMPLRDATDLAWTDALGNPLPTPGAESPTLTVSSRPRYLSGSGGTLLANAARAKVVSLANDFADNARFARYVPEALHRLTAAIGNEPEPQNARNRFFQLIRFLPELERQWHSGELPRTIAVPAIAHVARLARPLCVLEEAGGEAFLEPLSDTLLNCQEYQSLYLTGSVATSLASERGDWLMREVQRLTEEAQVLGEAGRHTEAAAVATLAEWRARALAHAAKAGPLSDAAQELPLSELPPEPEPEPEPEPVEESTLEPVEAPTETTVTVEPEEAPEEEIETPVVVEEETPAPPVVPLEAGQPAGTRKLTHTVVSGDNPDAIAKKYGVELDKLLEWNQLRRNSVIHINDKFTVYVPDTGAPTAPPLEEGQPIGTVKKIHTVKRGDFPGTIAKEYGVTVADFMKWNKLTSRSIINIDQELVVYVPAN